MRFKLLAAGSLLAATIVAGSAMLSAQTTAPAGNVAHGKTLFAADGCYLCHNYQGQGSGSRRAGVNPGPNLAPAPIPYAAFVHQVRTPRGTMPPYDAKIVSDQDVADIYAYLASQPPARDGRTIALLNVVHAGNPGNVPFGAVVYAANCSSCHGASGQGGVGPALKNESAKKNIAAVTVFVKNPPGAMPKLYPGMLSDGDVAAVSSYVETLR